MKRTITTLIIALCVITANAQLVKNGGTLNLNPNNTQGIQALDNSKAVGDTLLYTNMNDWFVATIDMPTFDMQVFDEDGLATHNAGYPTAFGFWYDTIAGTDWWQPYDVDTAFYASATSWFTPAGVASNWLLFGPVTLPAGADLSWYHRSNPYGNDGYEVKCSLDGMTSIDFNDAAIWSRPDAIGTGANDTIWSLVTVSIPTSYCNQPCYFAFHHTANDIDVLWLDEIKIVETIGAGVAENVSSIGYMNNMPNPANDKTNITFEINETGNVNIDVMDFTGRLVSSTDLGYLTTGVHNFVLNTSDLNEGIYFYSLNCNNQSQVKKMVIER